VRELADLEVGDVLPLDTAVHGDLVLLVGDEERFRCRPGRVGKHLAVQITGVIAEGGGHDAP
jgi:flagellar motor switch protein FliM